MRNAAISEPSGLSPSGQRLHGAAVTDQRRMQAIGNILIKLTLKNKLILGGLASVIVPFMIVGLVIYYQLSHTLIGLSKEQALHMASDVAASFDEVLAQERKLASSIAADPDIVKAMRDKAYGVVQAEIEAVYKRIGNNHFSLFALNDKGIIIADAAYAERIGLDLSARDYYLHARQGRTDIAGPMRSIRSSAPIVVVSAPIMDHNEFYGLVGIPFSIDYFVDLLSRHTPGRTGYGFLIDDKGVVLVHPRKELILNLLLFDQAGTEEIQSKVTGRRGGIAAYTFSGDEKIAGLARLKQVDWTAAFTQKKEDIMSPVNAVFRSIFISGLIFLGFTMLLISILSRRFSSPIQKVMEIRRQMTRHSTETVLQIGLDRKIQYANPAFEKMTGLRAGAVIGTEPCLDDNQYRIPPEEIWTILESGDSWSGRITLKGDKPDPITLEVMILALRDEQGAIHGYLLIGRDITAELLYENRLQQSHKLEAIGTLASGIAHDFNNILTTIFGNAELALMAGASVQDAQTYIRQIKLASERARDLVSQILTFSRQTEVELRPLTPASVLKEATKLLRASITTTIEIKTNINSDAMIMAEPTQLHQIVMNLFMNAAHAIGDKAGQISLDLDDFNVDADFIRTHPNINAGRHVRIRIADTGSGMDQATLDQIFEPFFTTKPHGHGTGLGLSVVHGIVDKLRGITTVYSEIGKGTVFTILIPCIESVSADRLEPVQTLQGGSEHIVIVDDEESIALTLKAILSNLGYTVTYYTDSVAALTAIQSHAHEIDIIITDYSMPKLTGLEMAEALRGNGIDIPMILTSGFLEKNVEQRARQVGINELVAKPVNTYQLTDMMRKIADATA